MEIKTSRQNIRSSIWWAREEFYVALLRVFNLQLLWKDKLSSFFSLANVSYIISVYRWVVFQSWNVYFRLHYCYWVAELAYWKSEITCHLYSKLNQRRKQQERELLYIWLDCPIGSHSHRLGSLRLHTSLSDKVNAHQLNYIDELLWL